MVKKKKKLFQKISILVPVFGICIFIILYFYAASLYPGSIRNGNVTEGFSFTSDYWCDLLDIIALNGELNDARPAALISTIILSGSLSFFWYYVPCFSKRRENFIL